MKSVYFTSYRCNCTALESLRESIPSRCPQHDTAIIYGRSGAHELIEVEDDTQMGVTA